LYVANVRAVTAKYLQYAAQLVVHGAAVLEEGEPAGTAAAEGPVSAGSAALGSRRCGKQAAY
jgi:hypothetical protein